MMAFAFSMSTRVPGWKRLWTYLIFGTLESVRGFRGREFVRRSSQCRELLSIGLGLIVQCASFDREAFGSRLGCRPLELLHGLLEYSAGFLGTVLHGFGLVVTVLLRRSEVGLPQIAAPWIVR